jgi:ankyrin repeat protein
MTKKQPKRKPRPGVDGLGRTPLHYAALYGDSALVLELLKNGQNPDAADDNSWTPLHFATQSSAYEVVQILINQGATIDSRDSHGNTPLSNAVFHSRGNGEIIKLLRSVGANPHAENLHGVSPLKLAHTIANYNMHQFFDDLPLDKPHKE